MMEVPSLFKNEENEISVPACVTDVEMNSNVVNDRSEGENLLRALIPAESPSFDMRDSISISGNIFPSGNEALGNDIIISKELNGIKNLFEDCSDISLDESRCATNKERLEDVYDKNVDSDLFFSNPTSCNSLNDTLLPDCNSLNVTLPHTNNLNVTLLPDSQKVDILEETEKIHKNSLTVQQGTNNCINANSNATKVDDIQKENKDSSPLDLVNNDYPSPESQSINDCKEIKLIEKNLNNKSPVKIDSSKDLDGDNPSLDIPCIDDGREIGLSKKSFDQLHEVDEVFSNDLENGNSLPDCRPINDSKESNSNEKGFNNTTSNEKNDSSCKDLNNDGPLPDSQCNENFKDLNCNGKSDSSPNSVNYDNPLQDNPFIDDCKQIFLNSNEKMLNNISNLNKPFSSVNVKVDNLSLDKLGINIPMETNSNTNIDNHIETNSDITVIDKDIETNAYITNINNHIATNSDVTDIDNHIDKIPNPKSGNHINLMVNGAKNCSKETPKRNENEVINVCDMFSTIDGSHDEKTKLESFKKCDEANQMDNVLELLEQNNTARTNEEVVDDVIQTSSTSCDALINSVVNAPCGKPEDSALLLLGTKATKFNNSNKYTSGDEILEEFIDSNNETIIKSNELLIQVTTSLSNEIPLLVAVETVHVQSKDSEILSGTNYSCNGKKGEETIHRSVQVPTTEVGKVNNPDGCSDVLHADNSNGRENKMEKSPVTSVKYLSMEVENEISLVDSSSNLEASQMFQTSGECNNIIKDKIAQSICEDFIDNPENKDSNSTTFIKAYRSKHISGEEVHGSKHVSGDVGNGSKHIPNDVPKSKHISDEEVWESKHISDEGVCESKQIYGDAVAINKLLDKSVTNDTFDIKIGKNRKLENQTEQNHNLVDVEEINNVGIFQSVQENLKKKVEDQFVINHIESKPDVNHIKKQGISGELSIVDYEVNKNEGCIKNLSLQTSSRDVKLSPDNKNIVDYPGECSFVIDGDFISNADRKIVMTNQLYDKKMASTDYEKESTLDYQEEEIQDNNTKYKISTRNNLFSSSTVSSTECKITNKKKNSHISPYYKKSDIKACSVNLSKSRVGNESLAENTDVNPSTPHFNTLKRKLEVMLQCAQNEEQNALKELKRMKKEKALVLKDILQEIQKVKKKFRI